MSTEVKRAVDGTCKVCSQLPARVIIHYETGSARLCWECAIEWQQKLTALLKENGKPTA